MDKSPEYSDLYIEDTALLAPVSTTNYPRRVSEDFESDVNSQGDSDDKVILEIGGPDSKGAKYDDISTTTFYHKKYDKTSPHQRVLYRSDSPNSLTRMQCDSRDRIYIDHGMSDRDSITETSTDAFSLSFELSNQSDRGKKSSRFDGLSGGECVADYTRSQPFGCVEKMRLPETAVNRSAPVLPGVSGEQNILRMDNLTWRERALQLERGCAQPLFTTPYGDINKEIRYSSV